MDAWTYNRVQDLYSSMGAWSRNRSFNDFNDARTHRALRLARHLAGVRRAMETCAAGGGRCNVEQRQGGGVAIHFDYLAIAAQRTVFLSDREFQLISKEVPPACVPPTRPVFARSSARPS